MEMTSANHENAGPFWHWLTALPEKAIAKVVEVARKAKKLGQDDPRRIIHSLKVGLALTLVSLFYYFRPLYNSFGGVSATWAVLTVVLVLEFSVGATLGKGLNRMFATFVAGALGVGAHYLASLSGEMGEPILLGLFIFLIEIAYGFDLIGYDAAAAFTFLRFCPRMKARYDYGLLIFILTFTMVSISSYRDDEVLVMAHQRLSTIVIGSCTSVIVCIFICPVWIGEDLHNLVAVNIEKLGSFLEGFGGEYFQTSEDGQSNEDKSFLQGYKSVLSSKSSEESMANLARWEPFHGRFRFRHPWKQYLKIGTLTRQCAYKIEALNIYLNSDIQRLLFAITSAPLTEHMDIGRHVEHVLHVGGVVRVSLQKTPAEMRSKIQGPCTKISSESGQTVKGLASAIKTMTRPSSIDSHIKNSKTAAENLKALLRTGLWEDGADLLEIIPAIAVASLLIDIVTCTEKISEAVRELASLAHFKSSVEHTMTHMLHQGTLQPFSGNDQLCHVITVDDSFPSFSENGNPSAPTTAQRMEV